MSGLQTEHLTHDCPTHELQAARPLSPDPMPPLNSELQSQLSGLPAGLPSDSPAPGSISLPEQASLLPSTLGRTILQDVRMWVGRNEAGITSTVQWVGCSGSHPQGMQWVMVLVGDGATKRSQQMLFRELSRIDLCHLGKYPCYPNSRHMVPSLHGN